MRRSTVAWNKASLRLEVVERRLSELRSMIAAVLQLSRNDEMPTRSRVLEGKGAVTSKEELCYWPSVISGSAFNQVRDV